MAKKPKKSGKPRRKKRQQSPGASVDSRPAEEVVLTVKLVINRNELAAVLFDQTSFVHSSLPGIQIQPGGLGNSVGC